MSGKKFVKGDPSGGIGYRGVSTGEGVWFAARAAARYEGLALDKATVAAEGWGEVGRAFGMAALRDGARIVAIQEVFTVNGERVPGVLVHPKGDKATRSEIKSWVRRVDKILRSKQDISKTALAKQFRAHADISSVKADIDGHNARARVLTRESVRKYAEMGTHQGKRRIKAEGSNGTETSDGAAELDRRQNQFIVIPGAMANFGASSSRTSRRFRTPPAR